METLFGGRKKKKPEEFDEDHKEIESFYESRRKEIEVSEFDQDIKGIKREMKREGEIEEKKEEVPIIPQMFECESCGNIFKDKWETCPACGGKVKEKDAGTIEIKIKENTNEPSVPTTTDSEYAENLPSIDDIFGEKKVPVTQPSDNKTIHETKIKTASLDTVFSFEEPKPKVRKVRKVKKVITEKPNEPHISFCPYCGKKLPPPTKGDWSFCLYCGMKLN